MEKERKLIYADSLLEAKEHVSFVGGRGGKTKALLVSMIERLIKDAPPVDAVEVVRCKECKKWNEIIGTCEGFASSRLPGGERITFITRETDYCSYGERKDNVQSST